MSANGISHLPLKSARQAAKLALAAVDRAAATPARPSTLDITQLPTQYPAGSNTNPLIDNPNNGGLLLGRPWA